MKYIALVLIKFYQLCVSPWLPSVCRYYPSCSVYAYDAVNKYGFFRGGVMAAKRIMRCHPFHSGGYDPVPVVLDNIERSTDSIENNKLILRK